MAVQKNNDQMVSLLTPWFIRRRDMGSGARVFNDANISTTTATLTVLTFNSERWDTHQYHSTSSNTSRLTVNIAGFYYIAGHVRFDANATGDRLVQILLDGTTIIAEQRIDALASGAFSTAFSISTIYQLTASQYVELRVLQQSGGNLNIVASGNRSPEFLIQRIL